MIYGKNMYLEKFIFYKYNLIILNYFKVFNEKYNNKDLKLPNFIY